MDKLADLHTHTTASDGCLTPSQVVEAASRAGLAAVAITDHDTVDGIDEALAAGERFGIEVIAGVEISAMYGEKLEVHVLGYFVDHKQPSLLKRLATLKTARWNRAREMVDNLNAAGVHVSFERVVELAQGGAIGRPHVAKAIVEAGAASSIGSAFGNYLLEGCPGYVPRYKVTPFEAMDMIATAGGIACCAHVAKLKNDELLVKLIDNGLRAIEVWHPDHNSAARRFYKRFARSRGLIATGGSDSHCFASDLRPGVGDVTVPYDAVIELRLASRLRNNSRYT
ncbi:MAG: PHP domain-containing protein [Armatimonadota bacterium]|nr:PHP domain-containing protein [bacterium]